MHVIVQKGEIKMNCTLQEKLLKPAELAAENIRNIHWKKDYQRIYTRSQKHSKQADERTKMRILERIF